MGTKLLRNPRSPRQVNISAPVSPNNEAVWSWRPGENDPWARNGGDFVVLNPGTPPQQGVLIAVEKKYFQQKYFQGGTVIPQPPTTVVAQMQTLANSFGISDANLILHVQAYVEYVNYCLNLIYRTAVGKRLLDFLLASNRQIKITLTDSGNKVFTGPDTLNEVARILAVDNPSLNATEQAVLRSTLGRTVPAAHKDNAYAWLADQVNAMPLLSHSFRPDSVGFLNRQGVRVSADQLQEWFSGRMLRVPTPRFAETFFPGKPVILPAFVQLAVIVALYAESNTGTPTSSGITFNIRRGLQNDNRPPAIGLAHELVHAYYNARGEQPGLDNSSSSTVLYEMLCMGVGPWDNEANPGRISENSIRAQWPPPGLSANDRANNLPSGKRQSYIPPTP